MNFPPDLCPAQPLHCFDGDRKVTVLPEELLGGDEGVEKSSMSNISKVSRAEWLSPQNISPTCSLNRDLVPK
ncbi:hypothetical protein SRHO_G00073080 [Serrasalmus rhombeus]